VLDLRGSEAFFGFVDAVFRDPANLEAEALARTALAFGCPPAPFEARIASADLDDRIESDMVLAERLGVNGTPHFLINGLHVAGAVPLEELAAHVDRELVQAASLRAQGIAAAEISARRTRENFRVAPDVGEEPAVDDTVWNVPIGDSPREGPDDALVTIIEFGDFQCPFCQRVQPTLAQLRDRYGSDLRIVWKHLPLPFHIRARPAATFAVEARKKLGDVGFWKAAELLYASAPHLEDSDLEPIARHLHLPWARTLDAMQKDADASTLDADMSVANSFEATGVPHFFINGRRLVGAQPLESFVQAVDRALLEARDLMKTSGVPRARVFSELMQRAHAPQ
jgi:protein-disulfide isomerase